jgi:hypothetical protein
MDMTEVTKFDQQQVGKLKLSEAIRIGARIRPQCTGRWFSDGKSCVIGAAIEGAGWREEAQKYEQVEHVSPWHWLEVRFGSVPYAVVDQMWRKNDAGKSRESIADWLEAQGL